MTCRGGARSKAMKNFLITCLTALAAVSCWAEPARPLVADTIPTATGSNAIARLKADGQFDSLQAAITAARYGAKADAASGDVFAANPSHGFSSRFSPTGLRLTARTGEGTNAVRYTSEWRLEAVGYGESLTGVPRGEVVAAGQRVELRRNVPAVVEWFENRPGGLEHGFTLAERPTGNSDGQPLRVRLAVDGDLQPVVEAGGQKLSLRNSSGATVLTYDKLKVWDANGRQVAAVMEAQPGQVLLTVLDAEAKYPLTIDPTFQQEAYLKASNTGTNDFFGFSVAVSGDTVVIGAYGESSNATGVNGNQSDNSVPNSGAAYVFVRNGVTWAQQAYLKASNPGTNDSFGYSVAISGDVIVVGANGEASSATGVNGNQADDSLPSGAAYIFGRNGTNWTQEAYLKASNSGLNDSFGQAVAVSGNTVVVGAYREDSNAGSVNGNQADNSAADSGAAYVFTRSGTNWTQESYLKASNAGGGDWFGWAVAISGDTVVIGAQREDSSATGVNGNLADNSAVDSGAAYIFTRSGTAWTQQAYLKASNTGVNDFFGYSVGIAGDTVVVGAMFEWSNAVGVNGDQSNNSVNGAGAAYVFVRSGAQWTQQAYLKASNTGSADLFGWSVAVSGDVVVVGAYLEDSNAIGVNGNQNDNSASQSGAAYVFTRSGNTWAQHAYLKASVTGAGFQFGQSVAVSGDTVVVGADREGGGATGVNGNQNDNSLSQSGAAYVFTGFFDAPEVSIDRSPDIEVSDGGSTDFGNIAPRASGTPQTFTIRNFGAAALAGVAITKSGTNQSDFAVSSPSSATVEPGGTATFTVTFSPKGPGLRSCLLTVASNDADENPYDITLTGVSIPTNLVQDAYLKASNSGIADNFGYSVALSGDTLVVGAPFEDSSATGVNGNQTDGFQTNSGAVYVFVRNGATWTQQAYLKASNSGTNDSFGYAVAVSGDTIVVGAYREDSNATGINGNQTDNSAGNSGAAYVFTRTGTTWTQQAYLKASNTGAGDGFGWSVSVSGDTAVVGAIGERSNAVGVNGNQLNDSVSLAGAAYAFVRNGTTWTQQAYLKASNTQVSGWFGSAVALSGDTLVVGSFNESSSAIGSGAAYVFIRNGATWTQQAFLKASNIGANDAFGWSAALSGDTVVVGARFELSRATGVNGNQADDSGNDAGAAYVFTRSGTTWTQQAYLKASNPGGNDYFGTSVAVSGDTVVVGAYGEDSNGVGVNGNQSDPSAIASGAAYVFIRNGTTWTQQAYLKASNTGANDYFGAAVAVSGSTFVVGAYQEDSIATGVNGNQADNSYDDSGGAYIFIVPNPEIAIEQPSGSSLIGGASSITFTSQPVGVTGLPLSFTLRSLGTTPLTGISASLLGANPGDFILNTNLIPTSLGASLSINFSVSFAPSASGYRSAILRITSNDEDESVFDIALVGIGLGTSSFTNSTALTIPSLGNASIYPSTITVSNVTGTVTDVRVRFTGFAHVGPDDVDALLVGPGGQVVALMSDAGAAWTVTNLNLTFTDRAATLLPDSSQISSGTNRPSNFPGTETLPPGATGTIGTNIMDLATNGVNGDWKLYVRDDSSNLGGGSLDAWSLTFELLPSAEMDLALTSGTNLVDGVSSVDFGSPPAGTNSVTTSFTLRNLGATNLTGIQVSKSGAHAGDFTLGTNGLPSSLAPGASASFTVTFVPGGSGGRSASLQIQSSDADEGSFDVALVGSGTSALQSWRQLNFGTTSNTGLAADTADADFDGVTNVVEFAFGLNPNSGASKQLPQGVVSNGNFVLTFTQPAGVGGVAYAADWSPTLSPGTWNPLTNTAIPPAHLFSVPTNGNPTIYMRLKISVADP